MSDTTSRWAYGGAGDMAGEDDRPEVEACIFCDSGVVALCFDYRAAAGQRVPVPSWVGLCGDCISDVQSQSFDAIVAHPRSVPTCSSW